MNILVIGNGFDLAHGLPTKYTDFLDWIKKYQQFYSYSTRKRTAGYREENEPILKYFNNLFYKDENKYLCDEIFSLIKGNFWLEYFLNTPMYQKEKWIDFESEISKVIQSLDDDMNLSISTHFSLDDKIQHITNEFLNQKYIDWFAKRTYKELRDFLLDDLNKLIRALEIYLCDYVQKTDITVISPDIQKITMQINSDTHTALPAKVLSFNYTNMFEKLYGVSHGIEYDYIHGKADVNNTIESNNMVLGIDEYLPDDRKDKDVEFIAFKKFYQRIYKETGCRYKEWVDRIRKNYESYILNEEKNRAKSDNGFSIAQKKSLDNVNKGEEMRVSNVKLETHKLYIFGHSLDTTDKDILRDLILNDNVYTTIFYLNKDVLGQQIANLVKVIGQDELIRRTGGSTKTIEFKQQQDMVERKP